MTEYQRKLVEEWLFLVEKVIRSKFYISNKPLLSYDDFYSVGCEAICKAAMQYDEKIGEFKPFACRVIYNAIIDYCRDIEKRSPETVDIESEDGIELLDLYASCDGGFEDSITDSTTMAALLACKERYSGVARQGVEAIELKMKGMKTSEIADIYGTTVNNVNAWIARARSKLRKEPDFCALLLSADT